MGRGRTRYRGQWQEPERRPRRQTEGEFDEDLYEYEEPPRRRVHRRRKRSVWPVLLTGCALGIFLTVFAAATIVFFAIRSSQGAGLGGIGPINNSHAFIHEDTQQVSLSAITQMQVCNKIGNVSMMVDPNADMATVTTQKIGNVSMMVDRNVDTVTVATQKIVHVASKDDAQQEFGRISIEVQPPGTISNPLVCAKPHATAASPDKTLTVNVTVPNSDGLLHNSGDSVNVTIKVPARVLPQPGNTSLLLDVEAPVGNVTIDGFSGVLTIKGSSGNVTVTHALLADGSHIETGQGDVTFNGLLDLQGSTQPRYMLQCEQGKIDVTLPSDTNVILDANTNVGKVNSEFAIDVHNNGGQVNYHGPLNAGTTPIAVLVLDVSTGDVNLHKA